MSSTASHAEAASTPIRALGRMSVIAGLALLLSAGGTLPVTAGSAPAAGGSVLAASKPVKIGTPIQSGAPVVAVDAAGTAIVAWANTDDLHGASNFVQYCVLPVGATACTHKGNLTPADSAAFIDDVQVLDDGGTLVILADVYGAGGSSALDYQPEQEWQSIGGGATFSIVNGGLSVSSGIVNGDTGPLGAVITPGTNALGYGWETAGGSPTFNEFPLSSPPECSVQTCAAGYATLEPASNPDQIGNGGGQFAFQVGSHSGVLGIFATDFTTGPFACSSSKTVPFGTAFAYASGAQSATNNYNVSPGTAHSAWRVPATQADCNVDNLAVAGGPSGFGVLEDNELKATTVYHRFDQGSQSFDTPMVTVARQTMLYPAVSQDGTGGVYATYLNGGSGGPLSLSYSYNGGSTWSGPATLYANTNLGASDVTSSVSAAGQGWAAWIDNGSVYAEPFTAQNSVPPPARTTVSTSQTSGTTTAPSITIPAGTVGETDTATIHGANAADATGTVTYGLYSKSSCVTSSRVFSSTAAVSHGQGAPSGPVRTALARGKYYWKVNYSGNAGSIDGVKGNDPSVSKCDSEALTVK
jgi:hypothetical protein